jgi:hypothetical protein
MSIISVALAFGSVSRGPISQMKAILVLTEAVICAMVRREGREARSHHTSKILRRSAEEKRYGIFLLCRTRIRAVLSL